MNLCLMVAAGMALAGGKASAQEAGPSIDEMFEAVGGAAGTSDAAPAAGGGDAAPRPRRPHGKPSRPPKKKPPPPRRKPGRGPKAAGGIEAELKAARSRAMLRANYYHKQNKPWHLAMTWVNLGEHKKALPIFNMMLRKRNYNVAKSSVHDALAIAPDPLGHVARDSYMERYGIVQFAYAWSLMNLGKHKPARQLLADAAPKLASYPWSPSGYMRDKKPIVRMTEEIYDATKARLEELEASLAEAPDGDKQWTVAMLCSSQPGKEGTPDQWRLDIPLKRLEALLTMVERHPEHRYVMNGEAHMQLAHTWRVFEMHEKSIEAFDELIERYAASGHVTAGHALWSKAESLARLGVLREEMGARDAVEAYRLSAAAFRGVIKRYPKSHLNKVGESGYSKAQKRAATLEAAVARISR
jgi:tetratricopeptide (TPR) repeat protein